MKKLLIVATAISALSFGSCMKTYTCKCPSPYGGNYETGTMKAMTKTEANRGCRGLAQDELCFAE
jgi:hypothetical protein